MHISADFDSGNIEVIELSQGRARLAIRKDHASDFYQWFHFRLTGARGAKIHLEIENAAGAAYPDGWTDYQAVVSADRETWTRVPGTRYADGVLSLDLQPTHDAVWLAYFAPYSMERHHDLVARCVQSPLTRLERLGATLDGQDLDLLRIHGDAADTKQAWIIARQHPGESMAEWWMEGFLHRLLDDADPVSRALLRKLTFHVVPNMNPDGSRRGHLRTNAAGANLNREWAEPTMERSPEVKLVRDRMDQRGVDFFLDVHGDEALPYNFIAGCEGIPSITERQTALLTDYQAALMQASPDFQTEHGYPKAAPGKANLTMATGQVGERFGCVAMTLEQPFKDNANDPDPVHGWSPERCRKLGRACLDALYAVADELR